VVIDPAKLALAAHLRDAGTNLEIVSTTQIPRTGRQPASAPCRPSWSTCRAAVTKHRAACLLPGQGHPPTAPKT